MWIQSFLKGLEGVFNVKEFCLCPGSRNAKLVKELSLHTYHDRTHLLFDERSAAFFAIGRILSIEHPVAVITTSGTAVGELLPAVMEAYHSRLPLILITADLPVRFLDKGYPQSTNQKEIFSSFVIKKFELSEGEQLDFECFRNSNNFNGPIHINLRLEDPLSDTTLTSGEYDPSTDQPLPREISDISRLIIESKAPLVVVGALDIKDHQSVVEFISRLHLPCYIESLSGLRENSELDILKVIDPNGLFKDGNALEYNIDLVIRIGGIPVHSVWRNLDRRFVHVDILSITNTPLPGTSRNQSIISGDVSDTLQSLLSYCTPGVPGKATPRLSNYLKEQRERLTALLLQEERSEPGMIHALSKIIPNNALVYLGNSLPIREWDLAASNEPNTRILKASRGLNGIDGQLSTFLGLCDPSHSNWGIFGDLTALYDLSAPWLIHNNGPFISDCSPQIVIINNHGGRIFERMYREPEFLNSHTLDFENWAKLWSIDYILLKEVPNKITWDSNKSHIIELQPDKESTNNFWLQFDDN